MASEAASLQLEPPKLKKKETCAVLRCCLDGQTGVCRGKGRKRGREGGGRRGVGEREGVGGEMEI